MYVMQWQDRMVTLRPMNYLIWFSWFGIYTVDNIFRHYDNFYLL